MKSLFPSRSFLMKIILKQTKRYRQSSVNMDMHGYRTISIYNVPHYTAHLEFIETKILNFGKHAGSIL